MQAYVHVPMHVLVPMHVFPYACMPMPMSFPVPHISLSSQYMPLDISRGWSKDVKLQCLQYPFKPLQLPPLNPQGQIKACFHKVSTPPNLQVKFLLNRPQISHLKTFFKHVKHQILGNLQISKASKPDQQFGQFARSSKQ